MWPAFEVKDKAPQSLSLAVGRVGLQYPVAARVGRLKDGSLGNVLDLQGWQPELHFKNLHRNGRSHSCNHSCGEIKAEGSLGLTGPASRDWLVNFRPVRNWSYLKRCEQRSWGWCPRLSSTSICTCKHIQVLATLRLHTHTHTTTHARTHTHTHIHTHEVGMGRSDWMFWSRHQKHSKVSSQVQILTWPLTLPKMLVFSLLYWWGLK